MYIDVILYEAGETKMLRDDSIRFDINPADIVVPAGWTVLSHGTSFDRWNRPFPGREAQDLRNCDTFLVGDTVDGGLACSGERGAHLVRLYAGQNDPLILRVLVPQYGPEFDVATMQDANRFLKPDHIDADLLLVPSRTTLIKVSEKATEGPNAPAVIWCVPSQFAELLERAFAKQKRAHVVAENNIDAYVPDLSDSFAAAEVVEEMETVLGDEEQSDEYFEDLIDQLQAEVDAQVEAEEGLAAKRQKDKERARALDKRNFARAEAEHAQQMAETNAAREAAERQRGEGSSQNSADAEPYVYSDPYSYDNQPVDGFVEPSAEQGMGSEPLGYGDPQAYEQPPSEPSSVVRGGEAVASPDGDVAPPHEYGDGVYGPSEAAERRDGYGYDYQPEDSFTSPPAEQGEGSSESFGYGDSQAYEQQPSEPFSASDRNAVGYDPSTAHLSDSEIRNRQLADADAENARALRDEEMDRERAAVQEEALRRQKAAEEYESFGSHGVDFSGHDQHAVHTEMETHPYVSSVTGPGSEAGFGAAAGVVGISAEAVQRYADEYWPRKRRFGVAKVMFRSTWSKRTVMPVNGILKYSVKSAKEPMLFRSLNKKCVVMNTTTLNKGQWLAGRTTQTRSVKCALIVPVMRIHEFRIRRCIRIAFRVRTWTRFRKRLLRVIRIREKSRRTVRRRLSRNRGPAEQGCALFAISSLACVSRRRHLIRRWVMRSIRVRQKRLRIRHVV